MLIVTPAERLAGGGTKPEFSVFSFRFSMFSLPLFSEN